MKELTVVLTVYNREEKYLRKAIEAVLNQTYTEFDFVILNNGSTNNAEEVIMSYSDERITYIRNEANENYNKDTGVLRKWFALAKTKYVVWTHDDDIMLPDMLAKEMECIKKDESIGFVSVNAYVIDETDGILYDFNSEMQEDVYYDKTAYIDRMAKSLSVRVPICPSVMYRREIVVKCLDELIEEVEPNISIDVLLWLKINEKYKIVILKDILYKYRISRGQVSNNRLDMMQTIYLVVSEFLRKYTSEELYQRYKQAKKAIYEANIISSSHGDYIKSKNICTKYLSDKLAADRELQKSFFGYDLDILVRLAYLNEVFSGKQKCYYLWGSGSCADRTKSIMDALVPEMICKGYIDGLKSGEKDGLKIINETDFDFSTDDYIVIATTAVGAQVCEKLRQHGKKDVEDFIFGMSFIS